MGRAGNPHPQSTLSPVRAMIKLDPQNARKHGVRNKQLIKDSLVEFGPARSIVIDENDVVIAGNGVLEQAKALDIPVEVIDANGMLYAVRVSGLTETQKKRLALIDNQATDLSHWDPQAFAEIREQETAAVTENIFTASEVEAITDFLSPPPSLDQLEDAYGSYDERSMWPLISLDLPPVIHQTYQALLREVPGADESQRLTAILQAIDATLLAPTKAG